MLEPEQEDAPANSIPRSSISTVNLALRRSSTVTDHIPDRSDRLSDATQYQIGLPNDLIDVNLGSSPAAAASAPKPDAPKAGVGSEQKRMSVIATTTSSLTPLLKFPIAKLSFIATTATTKSAKHSADAVKTARQEVKVNNEQPCGCLSFRRRN